MSCRGMIAVALIAALAVPTPALAAQASRKKEAAKLARQAKRHYQRSEFLEAAQLFQKSYELSLVPSQLRNAAKSYEKAEALDKAHAAWVQYEGLRISRDEKLEAEAHLDLIKEKRRKLHVEKSVEAARVSAESAHLEAKAARQAAAIASQRPPPPASAAPPPSALVVETTPEPYRPSIVPWFVLSGGVLLGIVSGILWGVAKSGESTLTRRINTKDGQDLVIDYTYEEAMSDFDGINRNRTASAALLGTSLAAVLAGAIWLTVDYSLVDEDPSDRFENDRDSFP